MHEVFRSLQTWRFHLLRMAVNPRTHERQQLVTEILDGSFRSVRARGIRNGVRLPDRSQQVGDSTQNGPAS